MIDLSALCPRWQELRDASRAARERAWAPYSKYHVGAAALASTSEIFSGCNVENASYGLTICAERVAMCSAIAAGHRDIQTVCVSLTGVPVPCGACRQFLHEFNSQMLILLDDLTQSSNTPPEAVRLNELLPRAFSLKRD